MYSLFIVRFLPGDHGESLFVGATNIRFAAFRVHQDGNGDDGRHHHDDDSDDPVQLPVFQEHSPLHPSRVAMEQLRLTSPSPLYSGGAGQVLRLVDDEVELFSALQYFV